MAASSIPKQHKACLYSEPGKIAIKVGEVETPQPGPGQVLVNLTHSGVCHSDLSVMTNGWKALPAPTAQDQVGGHEGVGTIAALGSNVEGRKVGDRVGIKWVADCCGSCASCLQGYDGTCFSGKISGYYTPGTFQQYALAPAHYVTEIPDGLSSEDAAPLLCAGITTYAAIRRSAAQAGQWVVISGAGGGLGHIAVQLASRGFALRVIGIDIGSKKELVMQSGAEHFFDATTNSAEQLAEEVKKVTGGLGASAAIVLHADNEAYASAVAMLGVGGTLVCVGIPDGDLVPIKSVNPATMVFKNMNVVGSAVGNKKDAKEVMEMGARGVVKTKIAVKKMEDLESVFKDMVDRKLQGRVVLDLR